MSDHRPIFFFFVYTLSWFLGREEKGVVAGGTAKSSQVVVLVGEGHRCGRFDLLLEL